MKEPLTVTDLARMGGNATKEKYGKKHFSELSSKRWKKQRKPTTLSLDDIGEIKNEDINELAEMFGYSAIARKLGISRQRIHQIAKNYRSFSTNGFSAKKYPGLLAGPCNDCGSEGKNVHHIDKNSSNNDPSNLVLLCKPCHYKRHTAKK